MSLPALLCGKGWLAVSIEARCGSCAARVKVPDGSAGKRFRCKKCGGVIDVPGVDVGAGAGAVQAPQDDFLQALHEAAEAEGPSDGGWSQQPMTFSPRRRAAQSSPLAPAFSMLRGALSLVGTKAIVTILILVGVATMAWLGPGLVNRVHDKAVSKLDAAKSERDTIAARLDLVKGLEALEKQVNNGPLSAGPKSELDRLLVIYNDVYPQLPLETRAYVNMVLDECFKAGVADAAPLVPPAELNEPIIEPLVVEPRGGKLQPSSLPPPGPRVFAFGNVRIRPPAGAYTIPQRNNTGPASAQAWAMGPKSATIWMRFKPAQNPAQKRMWLLPVYGEFTGFDSISANYGRAPATTTSGQLNGLGWSRFEFRPAPRTSSAEWRVQYSARVGDQWLIVYSDGTDSGPIDQFVHYIRPAKPNEAGEDPNTVAIRPAPVATRPKQSVPATIVPVPGGGTMPPEVEAVVRQVLTQREPGQKEALTKLAQMKPVESCREEIATILEDMLSGSPPLRTQTRTIEVADALVVWRRPRTIEVLAERLSKPSPYGDVRRIAVRVFVASGQPEAVAAMFDWAHISAEDLAEPLRSMGPVAETELIKFLADERVAWRGRAVRILKEIGTERCLPELRRVAGGRKTNSVVDDARDAIVVIEKRLAEPRTERPTAPPANRAGRAP